MSEPTDKQAACLKKFGYAVPGTFEEASAIIDDLANNGWKRPDGKPVPDDGPKPKKDWSKEPGRGPATTKQKAILEKYEYETDGVTFEDASSLISELAANNWEPLED
jgi:hypothetical protein